MKKPTNKPKKRGVSQNPPAGFEHIERYVALMRKHDLAELDWEFEGARVHLRFNSPEEKPSQRGLSLAALTPPLPLPSAPQAHAVPEVVSKTPQLSSNQKQIVSPFVGTFYRAPSPGADPYVREGKMIKRGDVLCIIEAMKLMNEIEGEFSGKITSILVENGQPVEFGEPLFVLEVL
ncbi:acetyl-CoA carboxylase biotin carboxyl carrier protein [Bdellovibrionota bacterium FG-2]